MEEDKDSVALRTTKKELIELYLFLFIVFLICVPVFINRKAIDIFLEKIYSGSDRNFRNEIKWMLKG